MRNVPVPNELHFISIKYFFIYKILTKIVEQNKCRYKSFFQQAKLKKQYSKYIFRVPTFNNFGLWFQPSMND